MKKNKGIFNRSIILKNIIKEFIKKNSPDDIDEKAIRSYLKELNVFCEILETRAGGVISSHCGPGTLGVLFLRKA